MIANYGYQDGSGDYFIKINTDRCVQCAEKPCVSACPENILEILMDDYDDEVVAVREDCRKKINISCSPCEPRRCNVACSMEGIQHSW